MNITKEDISFCLTEYLIPNLVGTKSPNSGKKISDVRVYIKEENIEYDAAGASFDTIKIEVKVSGPKGKRFTWERYYI